MGTGTDLFRNRSKYFPADLPFEEIYKAASRPATQKIIRTIIASNLFTRRQLLPV
jgi:hypothetical protein